MQFSSIVIHLRPAVRVESLDLHQHHCIMLSAMRGVSSHIKYQSLRVFPNCSKNSNIKTHKSHMLDVKRDVFVENQEH